MTGTDLRMGLYLLTSELNQMAVKYKAEIIHHYKNNIEVSKIIAVASEGVSDPTRDALALALQTKDVNPILVDRILESYAELDRSADVIKGIRHYFKNIITTRLLSLAGDTISDPSAYVAKVAEIEKLDFGEVSKIESAIKSKKFSELDVEALEESMKNVVPSFWQPLNESNPYHGYREQQLITVSGPPGSGKSLFLMQEALKSLELGRHVVYCAIGDLIEEDFIVRLAALRFKVPIQDIFLDFKAYKNRLLNDLPGLDDMTLLFIKPGALTASELKDYLYEKVFKKDRKTTFLIDYDSNLNGNESLYVKGDEIYCVAEEMAAQPGYLGFIATQPKIAFFECEWYGMNGLGESSRKAHISATIITIGLNPRSVNPVGYIYIAKQRRGTKKLTPYFRDLNGEFLPISDQEKSEMAGHASLRTIICNTSDYDRAESSKS